MSTSQHYPTYLCTQNRNKRHYIPGSFSNMMKVHCEFIVVSPDWLQTYHPSAPASWVLGFWWQEDTRMKFFTVLLSYFDHSVSTYFIVQQAFPAGLFNLLYPVESKHLPTWSSLLISQHHSLLSFVLDHVDLQSHDSYMLWFNALEIPGSIQLPFSSDRIRRPCSAFFYRDFLRPSFLILKMNQEG